MWRLAFIALASCSLISTSAQASGPTGSYAAPGSSSSAGPPASSDDDPERTIALGAYDKVPAKLPPVVTAPDVPAPPIVISKGPFSQRGSHVGGLNTFLPVSKEPASPWSGVSKGKPVTLAFDDDRWWIRDESLTCTAALDHCLPAYAWFFVDKVVTRDTHANAYPVVFVDHDDGKGSFGFHPVRPGPMARGGNPPYTAYRSVPATKKNLVAGARVFAFPDAAIPTGTAGVYDRWQMGIVARVDWDLGMVFLDELEQPFFISATRVAVLAFEPETGVTILGGKKRDELAVKAADVVLP